MELEELLKKVMTLLGENANELIAEFALNESCEIIKNYCNLEEVPKGLYFTAVRMTVDIYRNEEYGTEKTPSGSVSSVSIGDTSTSFATNSEFKNGILKNYEQSLLRYRRVVFK